MKPQKENRTHDQWLYSGPDEDWQDETEGAEENDYDPAEDRDDEGPECNEFYP